MCGSCTIDGVVRIQAVPSALVGKGAPMHYRKSTLVDVKPDMTPMIDCVFQLMIFFMLTLKLVAAEGTFDLNMPLDGQPRHGDPNEPLRVRMEADAQGRLASLRIGSRRLGNDEEAFSKLNAEVLRALGGVPGGPNAKDLEIEIDADANLHYAHVMQAVTACSGRFDERTQQVVRYVEKIRFASARSAGVR